MRAFNSRDHALFRAVFHRDVVLRRPLADAGGALPNDPETYHGIDEFIEVMDRIDEEVDDLQVSVRSVESGQGGRVLVELLQTFGPSEQREQQITWVVDEIRDGMIVFTQNFASEEEARKVFGRTAGS